MVHAIKIYLELFIFISEKLLLGRGGGDFAYTLDAELPGSAAYRNQIACLA
jgi:hypothetical protein